MYHNFFTFYQWIVWLLLAICPNNNEAKNSMHIYFYALELLFCGRFAPMKLRGKMY